MKKLLALSLVTLGAGSASAQVYSAPQPMPAQVVPAAGALTAPYGTVVPAGSFAPAVTGGVVTGQPYMLNQSVLGGTVVGMPGMTGNVTPQPFTTYSTGGTVVGGSYMANGSVPYTTFSPTTYSPNMTYPQPMGYTTGNQMMATPTPAGYTSVPYSAPVSYTSGYSAAPAGGPFGSVLTTTQGVVTRVVAVPNRVARRLFRR